MKWISDVFYFLKVLFFSCKKSPKAKNISCLVLYSLTNFGTGITSSECVFERRGDNKLVWTVFLRKFTLLRPWRGRGRPRGWSIRFRYRTSWRVWQTGCSTVSKPCYRRLRKSCCRWSLKKDFTNRDSQKTFPYFRKKIIFSIKKDFEIRPVILFFRKNVFHPYERARRVGHKNRSLSLRLWGLKS